MAGYFGVNTDLVDPKSAQERIVQACAKVWFEKNTSGLFNRSDCSGFVKAVQGELHLLPFAGNANSIFDEVEKRNDWQVLGVRAAGAAVAGAAANSGFFTVGIWYNPELDAKRHHKSGHVAVVTAYLPLLGTKAEQHALGAWGQIGGIGSTLDRMSKSFGSAKHSSIKYAKCLVKPVI